MKKYILQLIWLLCITCFLIGCGEITEQTETIVDPEIQDEEDFEETTENDSDTNETDENDKHTNQSQKDRILESYHDLTAHFIDAGQGDATLFQYSSDDESYTILYDAGNWNRQDVVHYLSKQNISYIDLIIISHPHADHIGQLAQIMNTFEVGEVWMSGNTTTSRTFQSALEAVLASGANYYEPRAGEVFDIGNLVLEVIHPEQLTGKLNEDSISVRMTYGDISFLLTGDAFKQDELAMLQRTDQIQAQILRLGHHGSDTSSHPRFLEAVQPEVAIYSAGLNNQYGHPHQEVIERIQQMGIPLYGTDVHGTIIVTTNGLDYAITTSKEGTVELKDEQAIQHTEKGIETDSQTAQKTDCIDINHASFEALQQIIHIGPVRAEELISLRPFQSVDDLIKINGIGKSRLNDIKTQGLACVGG